MYHYYNKLLILDSRYLLEEYVKDTIKLFLWFDCKKKSLIHMWFIFNYKICLTSNYRYSLT